MAKNGCIACNNSNIEAYLALLGYEIVKIVKKCAVISVKNTDDSKFVHYGVMNIETLEWVLEPQYHSYKNKNSLLQNNIIKAGFICMDLFKKIDDGTVDRHITIVDCTNGKIVIDNKRRRDLVITDKYIVTIKEVRDNHIFRCSFIDLKTRRHLDIRVNTHKLIWMQGMDVLPELSAPRWLGITNGYFKIPIYSDENLEFRIPKKWGKAYIYGTEYGIESELDVLRRELEDPLLIKITRVTKFNNKKLSEDSVYFWAAKSGINRKENQKENYIYYDRHGDVVGRRFRNLRLSEVDISNTLSKIIDSIENGETQINSDGIYEYKVNTTKDYQIALERGIN